MTYDPHTSRAERIAANCERIEEETYTDMLWDAQESATALLKQHDADLEYASEVTELLAHASASLRPDYKLLGERLVGVFNAHFSRWADTAAEKAIEAAKADGSL